MHELENLIERYVILGFGGAVSSELLSWEQSHGVPEVQTAWQIRLKKVTQEAVLDLERKIILSVLEANSWNHKRTATALEISYRTLMYKMRRDGLVFERGVGSAGIKTEPPVAAAD